MKVTIDRNQSGGDAISVVDDNGIQILNERIHLLPKKDGIVIYDSNNIIYDVTQKDEDTEILIDGENPHPRISNAPIAGE
jgi:ribose 5-phosphate isomerase